MDKIKTYIIHYKDVFRSVGITPNDTHIEEYLNGGRQDILENFDIFTENVRSIDRKLKNFDLFEQTKTVSDDCVVVVGFYLELLEYWGQRSRIYDVVKYYCELYSNNKVVVTWNHDIDAAQIFNFMDSFKNLYVLNFNTSVNHERYILLPFWTIDDELIIEEKKYLANLVCAYNNPIRVNLKGALINRHGIFVSDKVSFEQYRKLLSSSKFTLCPKGLGLSSYRFFEAFHSNSIPVLFADNIILPYQDRLNYNDFIIRIPENKSNDGAYIINLLTSADYDTMLKNMNNVREEFTLKGVQEEIIKRLI